MSGNGTGHGGKRRNAGRPAGTKTTPLGLRTALLHARADKERSLADLRQLDVRLRRGELIDAATSNLACQMLVGNARNRLLALPSRAAAAVTAMTPAEAQEFLRELVYEALTELANGLGVPAAGDA